MPGAVCIVSPGNLASNPRVLKEADALHEAGYAVTAVVCDYTEALRPFDDEIAAGAPWKVVRVARPAGERQVGRAARGLAKAATGLGLRVPVGLAASAYGGPVSALRRAAQRGPGRTLHRALCRRAGGRGRRRTTAWRHAGLRCRGLPCRRRHAVRHAHGAHHRGRVAAGLPACHRRRAADRQGLCRAVPRRADDGAQCLSAGDGTDATAPAGRARHIEGLLVLPDHRPRPRPAIVHPGNGAHQDARYPRRPRRQPVGPRRAAGRAGARARHRRPGQSAADRAARGDGEAGRVLRHRPVARDRRQREPPGLPYQQDLHLSAGRRAGVAERHAGAARARAGPRCRAAPGLACRSRGHGDDARRSRRARRRRAPRRRPAPGGSAASATTGRSRRQHCSAPSTRAFASRQASP